MDAGRILREARRRSGLSQEALARRARVPQTTVDRIENRRRVPRVDTLDKLLEVCGSQLILTRRLGIGIDREPIRRLLNVEPAQRLGPRPHRLISFLAWRRIRFILIGTAAERIHGSPGAIDDVLVCVAGGVRNRRYLRSAAETLQQRRFMPDPPRWRWTPPPPFRRYDDLRRGAIEMRFGQRLVPVASLDDLIRIRLAGRSRASEEAAELLGAVRDEAEKRSRRAG